MRLLFVGMGCAVLAGGALAQRRASREAANYPTKPIRFVVDTLKDFERVSLVTCAPNVLVVHSSVPVNIDKLNAEIVRILRLPEIRARLETLGFEIVGGTPEEFTAFAQADIAKWAKALKEAGIKPE